MAEAQPIIANPREELAAAIRRKNLIKDRLARIETASGQLIVWTAQEALENAEQALEKARKEEPRRLVAGLVGEAPSSGPSVSQAEWALEEARDDLKRARATREALDGQRQAAEHDLERADFTLRDSVRKVVQAEAGTSKLLVALDDARREVARLHEILTLLDARNCLHPHWDTIRPFPRSQADSTWRNAIAALEKDAYAPLPK